jgi:predicted protein tyrosine phosphatase
MHIRVAQAKLFPILVLAMLWVMSLFHRIFDQFYPVLRFIYEKVMGNRWYDEIVARLWLGGAPTYQRDYDYLLGHGVNAVIDIRQERSDDLELYAAHDVRHLKLAVPDIRVPSPEIITQGVAFIEENLRDGRTVYVHCAKGRGRSATLIAAYLMKSHRLSFAAARQLMESKRSLTKLEARHQEVLERWLEAINN